MYIRYFVSQKSFPHHLIQNVWVWLYNISNLYKKFPCPSQPFLTRLSKFEKLDLLKGTHSNLSYQNMDGFSSSSIWFHWTKSPKDETGFRFPLVSFLPFPQQWPLHDWHVVSSMSLIITGRPYYQPHSERKDIYEPEQTVLASFKLEIWNWNNHTGLVTFCEWFTPSWVKVIAHPHGTHFSFSLCGIIPQENSSKNI